MGFIVIITSCYFGGGALHDIDITHNALVRGNYHKGYEIVCNFYRCGIKMEYQDIYMNGMQDIVYSFIMFTFGGILFGYGLK